MELKEYLIKNLTNDSFLQNHSLQELLTKVDIKIKNNDSDFISKSSEDYLPSIRVEIHDRGKYLILEKQEDYDVVEILNLCLKKGIVIDKDFLVKKIEKNKKNIIYLGKSQRDSTKDSQLKLTYSENKIILHGEITPPKLDGCLVTKKDILQKLEEEGIVNSFFILENIESLFISQFYQQKKIMIAQGIYPINQADSYFENLILEEAQEKKEFRKIYSIKKGQTILKKKQEIEKKDGKNLFNQTIYALEGTKEISFPDIENTYNDLENGLVISNIDGHMLISSKGEVLIKKVLTISKDILYYDEPIQTNGCLELYGSLINNKIEAKGNIYIHGTVENSTIISGGEILIENGIINNKKENLYIKSKKGITVKFAQKATLVAQEEVIFQEYLRNCDVFAEKITNKGNRGEVVGGRNIALHKIQIGFAGSIVSQNTQTFFRVGANPLLIEKNFQLEREIVFIRKKIENSKLKNQNIDENDDNPYQERLNKLLKEMILIKKKILEEISFGEVSIFGKIYKGTKVTCGDKELLIKNDMSKVIFKNTEEEDHVVVESFRF